MDELLWLEIKKNKKLIEEQEKQSEEIIIILQDKDTQIEKLKKEKQNLLETCNHLQRSIQQMSLEHSKVLAEKNIQLDVLLDEISSHNKNKNDEIMNDKKFSSAMTQTERFSNEKDLNHLYVNDKMTTNSIKLKENETQTISSEMIDQLLDVSIEIEKLKKRSNDIKDKTIFIEDDPILFHSFSNSLDIKEDIEEISSTHSTIELKNESIQTDNIICKNCIENTKLYNENINEIKEKNISLNILLQKNIETLNNVTNKNIHLIDQIELLKKENNFSIHNKSKNKESYELQKHIMTLEKSELMQTIITMDNHFYQKKEDIIKEYESKMNILNNKIDILIKGKEKFKKDKNQFKIVLYKMKSRITNQKNCIENVSKELQITRDNLNIFKNRYYMIQEDLGIFSVNSENLTNNSPKLKKSFESSQIDEDKVSSIGQNISDSLQHEIILKQGEKSSYCLLKQLKELRKNYDNLFVEYSLYKKSHHEKSIYEGSSYYINNEKSNNLTYFKKYPNYNKRNTFNINKTRYMGNGIAKNKKNTMSLKGFHPKNAFIGTNRTTLPKMISYVKYLKIKNNWHLSLKEINVLKSTKVNLSKKIESLEEEIQSLEKEQEDIKKKLKLEIKQIHINKQRQLAKEIEKSKLKIADKLQNDLLNDKIHNDNEILEQIKKSKKENDRKVLLVGSYKKKLDDYTKEIEIHKQNELELQEKCNRFIKELARKNILLIEKDKKINEFNTINRDIEKIKHRSQTIIKKLQRELQLKLTIIETLKLKVENRDNILKLKEEKNPVISDESEKLKNNIFQRKISRQFNVISSLRKQLEDSKCLANIKENKIKDLTNESNKLKSTIENLHKKIKNDMIDIEKIKDDLNLLEKKYNILRASVYNSIQDLVIYFVSKSIHSTFHEKLRNFFSQILNIKLKRKNVDTVMDPIYNEKDIPISIRNYVFKKDTNDQKENTNFHMAFLDIFHSLNQKEEKNSSKQITFETKPPKIIPSGNLNSFLLEFEKLLDTITSNSRYDLKNILQTIIEGCFIELINKTFVSCLSMNIT